MGQKIDEQIMKKYIASFNRGASPRTMERLRWMFFDNPVQDSMITFEEMEGKEHYACMNAGLPVFFKHGSDEKVKVMQVVDSLTDVEARGKGLFSKLSIELNKYAASQGYKYVYGFPHPVSSRVFFGKTNWHYYSPVPHKVKLVNLCFPLNMVLKTKLFITLPGRRVKADIREISEFSEEHRAFLDEINQQYKFGICRNVAYMNWRITQHPNHDYKIFQLNKDGKIAGLAIINIKYGKHNANIGYVMDLLYRTGDDATGTALLSHCMRAFAQAKTDIVFAWNKSSDFNGRSYSKLGFRLIPEKLRKIKLSWGVGVLDAALTPPAKEDFYISYLDSDTV